MMMSKLGGASVQDIMEETKCSAVRVRVGVSEIRKKIGVEAVLTHPNLKDTTLTRYEIFNSNKIEAPNSIKDDKYLIRENTSAVTNVETILKPLPGNAFSDVFYGGSDALVSLNSQNKYVKKYKKCDPSIKTLRDVALALDLANKLLTDEGSSELKFIVEKFQLEFSRQLQNLSKNE